MARQRGLLVEFARVQSARLEERRRRTSATHQQTLEARRETLAEKEAAEQRRMQQRQEVRLYSPWPLAASRLWLRTAVSYSYPHWTILISNTPHPQPP